MKIVSIALVIGATLVATPAIAQTYIGAGVGVANTDTQRTSGKVFVGIQVIPNIGVEASYTDLGNYRDSSASALSLAFTGTLPLGSTWDLFGKWGASQNHTNYSSLNNTDSMVGFGIGFNVSPVVALRFEYENFGKLPTDRDGTSTLATSKGLSVKYSF
jgi:opacity protein-like surface antigen